MSRAGWPDGAWSHSQFATLRRCPKAHKLRYKRRLQLVGGEKSDALLIGSGFHRGRELVTLEALRGAETDRAVWDSAVAVASAECPSGPAAVEVVRLLRAYQLKYGCDNAGYGHEYEVAGAEQVFTAGDLHASIGGFASIADAHLIRNIDGRHVLVEAKTAGRSPSGTIEHMAAERRTWSQTLSLAYCGWQELGEIPLILYDIVVKNTKPVFFRVPVEVTEADLLRWRAEQEELEQLVPLSCANRDACAPPVGFRCEFFDYCHGSDEDRNAKYEIRPSRELPVDGDV